MYSCVSSCCDCCWGWGISGILMLHRFSQRIDSNNLSDYLKMKMASCLKAVDNLIEITKEKQLTSANNF